MSAGLDAISIPADKAIDFRQKWFVSMNQKCG
ncbi:hypothetical protein BANRA_02164 [Acinetobacter baumannii]|nr:hypothetical protein BANRA_02164 [Acinetobacter baumannii]